MRSRESTSSWRYSVSTRPTGMKRLAQMLIVDAAAARLLLAFHKTGDMQGYYTGFLDELLEDEEPMNGARRITMEQCGLTVEQTELRAVFRFSAQDYPGADEYEYYTSSYGGELSESENVRPQWFGLEQIPYQQMPADDALWYPSFLAGKLQRGSFHFGPGMKELLHYELFEVDDLRN